MQCNDANVTIHKSTFSVFFLFGNVTNTLSAFTMMMIIIIKIDTK